VQPTAAIRRKARLNKARTFALLGARHRESEFHPPILFFAVALFSLAISINNFNEFERGIGLSMPRDRRILQNSLELAKDG
jgi:hypothetical protein